MKTPTFRDWIERRKFIRETFPDDLLEDLQDSEPALYLEAKICDENIVRLKNEFEQADQDENELENSVSPIALLPSILTPGWNRPRIPGDRTKNWPDMENLLKLYAIGLYFKNKSLTLQALHDKQELTEAVEEATISRKHPHPLSAETRFLRAPTYLKFGLRTLDTFFTKDATQRNLKFYDLDREIDDAFDGNSFNGAKLQKSKNMALRVARTISDRYKA